MVGLNGEPQSQESASQEFLNLCLRARWEPSVLVSARDLTQQHTWDWPAWYQGIEQEALAPLLHTVVRGQALLPGDLEVAIAQRYYQNACRNTLLLRELEILLQQLSAQDISVLLLKGAALAERVYGDIAARPMTDLDVLIHPHHLAIARETLAQSGYTLAGVEMQTGYADEFRSEETWVKTGVISVYVDLHWHLMSPVYYRRRLTDDWLWQSAQAIAVNQTPALSLGHEALILHLCAHLLLHHGGQGAVWLHDIAAVIQRYHSEIDWQLLLLKAQEYDFVLSLQKILTRVVWEWQVSVPDTFLQELHQLQPSAQELQIYHWLSAPDLTSTVRCFLADLAGLSNWPQRLRFAWNTIFPTQSYMQHRYRISHPALTPFYYFYRWWRGLQPF